jgi:hypothetical protein
MLPPTIRCALGDEQIGDRVHLVEQVLDQDGDRATGVGERRRHAGDRERRLGIAIGVHQANAVDDVARRDRLLRLVARCRSGRPQRKGAPALEHELRHSGVAQCALEAIAEQRRHRLAVGEALEQPLGALDAARAQVDVEGIAGRLLIGQEGAAQHRCGRRLLQRRRVEVAEAVERLARPCRRIRQQVFDHAEGAEVQALGGLVASCRGGASPAT